MFELTAQQIADAAGGTLHTAPDARRSDEGAGPLRAVIDSREAGAGDVFFGLPGTSHDGGAFAAQVIEAGAWGVVVGRAHASAAVAAAAAAGGRTAVVTVDDPIAALGAVATAWRRCLGAQVVGITGSTGKTSTKDILAALIGRSRPVVATPENLNTEIGLPLTVLSAPAGTEVLVLEMAMRGPGQIAELARIAEPDLGCIVNIGPVHLEQLGSIEAVAAAKAELFAELRPGATAVFPCDEPLLGPYRRSDLVNVSFGGGGDVRLLSQDAGVLTVCTPDGEIEIAPSFTEEYLVRNLLAAVACAHGIGVRAGGPLEVRFSSLRGEVIEVLGGVTLINDCYNANPDSMRAALDNLAAAEGRRIAVLGGMAELGDESDRYHHEIAEHASAAGVDLTIAVGELAGAYGDAYRGAIEHVASPAAAAHIVRSYARPGDTVLIKGSRSVGLEQVAEILVNASHPLGSARPRSGAA